MKTAINKQNDLGHMDDSPIFIHSLYRSGSTWLFDRFRQSENQQYWCYQEPFHEAMSLLKDDPDALLHEFSASGCESLRHPTLKRPYFYEFHEIRSHIKESFQPCISYQSFFDLKDCPSFDDYVGRLIQFARGRPVLQCCRSFGRSEHLKRRYGGVHVYLWRNPWDQWWSYQINDYFDTANVMILFADRAPKVFCEVREVLGLGSQGLGFFDFKAKDILTPSQRYLIFFTFWLYGLLENKRICDCLINIDKLSEEPSYIKSITKLLESFGVVGVNFSSCDSPRSQYGAADIEFFEGVESKVYDIFRGAGYDHTAIEEVASLRKRFSPQILQDSKRLAISLERVRSLALGWETDAVHRYTDAVHRYNEQGQSLRVAKGELEAIKMSRSWSVTRPLRRIGNFYRKLRGGKTL